MKRCQVGLVLLMAVLLLSSVGSLAADYPTKDIHMYIFSSMGGGTDVWTRHLSSLMEQDLGVNIIANNLPGANGGNGGMRVWNAPHDGYTVLGASETSLFFGVNDAAPTAENWEFFIGGSSPGVIAVKASSPYETIGDLVDAAKNGRIKISNSGRGKLWHVKAVQLQTGAGVEFQHIPYNGSAPALTALLSGEVEAVSASAGEVAEHVRSGLLRPLIMTEAVGAEFEGYGYVESATTLFPDLAFEYENLFQWLGFMLPADTPSEVLQAFGEAFERAMEHPRTDEFANIQNARKIGLWGPEAKELALRMQSVASWVAEDFGVAKKSPEELGIPRP